MFLFGAIISSTDPVAVLALFKELGAPKKLTLIFEGESLFNDWTWLALFFVIFEIIQAVEKTGVFSSTVLWKWVLSFFCMVIGWIILWIILWIIFSHVIKKISNNEQVEIGLTIVLGFLAFILSDLIGEHLIIAWFAVKISGVIATAYAAIVMWNYGKTKISPKVEEYMEKFWSFFAHMANWLVFLLMGLLLQRLDVNLLDFIPHIVVVIIVVVIARALSVYIPLWIINKLHLGEKIPTNRQHLLARWSLRWALVLMMILLIPDDFSLSIWKFPFSIKQFFLALGMGCVMFTLFFKAVTVGWLLKRLQISKPTTREELEKNEAMILVCLEILEKVDRIKQKQYITTQEAENLRSKYRKKMNVSIENIKKLLKGKNERSIHDFLIKAISFHAIGIERQALKDLFVYNQIKEDVYRYYIRKLNAQVCRIEKGLPQIKTDEERGKSTKKNLIEKIHALLFAEEKPSDEYIKSRTKKIIVSKVIVELARLKEKLAFYNAAYFDEVISLYEKFYEISATKCTAFYGKNEEQASIINEMLTNKKLVKMEEKTIKWLLDKEMISPRTYKLFIEEIEEEIAQDS